MKMMKKAAFACAAALVLCGAAFAADYPRKPITMVVGYAAGGG